LSTIDANVLGIAAGHIRGHADDPVAGAKNAQHILAFALRAARVARLQRDADDAISGLPPRIAGCRDRTRELVTEHRSRSDLGCARFGRVDIRSADAAVGDLHEHLPGRRRRLGALGKAKWLTGLLEL
jgi:hypothetical protein